MREIVGGFGADLVMDCAGHPSAGPEGIEMLRDGGTYVEMGQFTDAGAIETNWHRICTKDITHPRLLGLHRQRHRRSASPCSTAPATRYPWYEMQTLFRFDEQGIAEAIAAAREMRSVKSTIVLAPELLWRGTEQRERRTTPTRVRRAGSSPARPSSSRAPARAVLESATDAQRRS